MNKSMFLMFLLLGVLAGSVQGVIGKKDIAAYKKLEPDDTIDKNALRGDKLAIKNHNQAILYIQITTADAIADLKKIGIKDAASDLQRALNKLSVASNVTKHLSGCSETARKNLLGELDRITKQISSIKGLKTSKDKLNKVKEFAKTVDAEITRTQKIFEIKSGDSTTTRDLKNAVQVVQISWEGVLRNWDLSDGLAASKTRKFTY